MAQKFWFVGVCVAIMISVAGLSAATAQTAASGSRPEGPQATTYRLNVVAGAQSVKQLASNMAVVRFTRPGTYVLSLRTDRFEPFLLVFRNKNLAAYRTSRADQNRVQIRLQVGREVFAGKKTHDLTIVVASRSRTKAGRAVLTVTPGARILPAQQSLGQKRLRDMVQPVTKAYATVRRMDHGRGVQRISKRYVPERPSPVANKRPSTKPKTSFSIKKSAETSSGAREPASVSAAPTSGSADGITVSGPGDLAIPPMKPAAEAPVPMPKAPSLTMDRPAEVVVVEPAARIVEEPVLAEAPPLVALEPAPPLVAMSVAEEDVVVVAAGESPAVHDNLFLPNFKPWPPPQPTAMRRIPKALYLYPPFLDPDEANLGDVSDLIEAAMGLGGYERFAYFRVPGGFAVVTQLEQIQENGLPVEPASARWNAAIAGPQSFGIKNYLESLFFARVGYYRVIVFTVLAKPLVLGSEELEEDPNWIGEGASALPHVLRQERFGDRHDVTVLVYEFERHEVDPEPRFREDDDSSLSASDHLKGAKFSNYFETGAQ